jgi:hypothetical protein
MRIQIKKSYLASVMAATLGMSGCDEKLTTQSLQTAYDQGQMYTNMIVDLKTTDAVGESANSSTQPLILALSVTEVQARIESVVDALTHITNRTLLQDERLERFKTYQTLFENIQTSFKTYFKLVQDTKYVIDCNNAHLATLFETFNTHLVKTNDELTLNNLNTMVDALHNLIQLEQAAVAEKAFAAVLTNALQGQYEAAVTAFDQGFALHESRQSLSTKAPVFVQQLEDFLIDIQENDDQGILLKDAANFTIDAQKLYQAFQNNLTDQAYIERFNAYFEGIQNALNQAYGLGDGNAVYQAIVNKPEPNLQAELAPSEVKVLLNTRQYAAVMQYILTQLRTYQATSLAGVIAQNNLETIDKLDQVLANLIAFLEHPEQTSTTISLAQYQNIIELLSAANIGAADSVEAARNAVQGNPEWMPWVALFSKPYAVIQQLIIDKKQSLTIDKDKLKSWRELFRLIAHPLDPQVHRIISVKNIQVALVTLHGLTPELISAADANGAVHNNKGKDGKQYPVLKRMLKQLAGHHYRKAETEFEKLKPEVSQQDGSVFATSMTYLDDLVQFIDALVEAGEEAAALQAEVRFIQTAYQYDLAMQTYVAATENQQSEDNQTAKTKLIETLGLGELANAIKEEDEEQNKAAAFKSKLPRQWVDFLEITGTKNIAIRDAVLQALKKIEGMKSIADTLNLLIEA